MEVGVPLKSSELRLVRQEPSTREIARDVIGEYRHRQRVTAARERIGCVAVQYGHVLGPWRVQGAADEYALVRCQACGAGASIDLPTAIENIGERMYGPCVGVPVASAV